MIIVNRVLAAAVALALIALAIIVPVEVVRAFSGRRYWTVPHPRWAQELRDTTWDAGLVRTICILVAVVGLLLLLAELKRRRPSALPLAPLAAGVEAATTRRSLQKVLQNTAQEVDGVDSATARVKRRSATITASPGVRAPDGLEQQITERVSRRLDAIGLAAPPRLKVKLSGGRS